MVRSKIIKNNSGERIFSVLNIILLSLLVIITLYPMIYVAFASVSDGWKLMSHSGLLLKPLGFTVAAYKTVFQNPMIGRGYLNTLIIVVLGVVVSIFMTAFGAYFLSRKNVLFKKFIMFFIVFTMFFKGGLIPLFFTVKQMGLYNSLLSVIVTFSINTFYLIIMRTAFMAIPDSLVESAKIDGANDFSILFRIIMPLSTSVIAVMILYYGVDRWNGWFYAMLFLRERVLYPLQLILREILIQNDLDMFMSGTGDADLIPISESVKYATIMVATLPILFVYPFVQKYFMKGVLIGAVKE